MLNDEFYNNPQNYINYNLLDWLGLENTDVVFSANSYKLVLEGHKTRKKQKSLI